ncbi:hypothetical protein WA026_014002 [Henosepilachna vigintioctopunctata]|uniref:Uncharacterized protein n=1 Tax=Henosepilachna vigintioctopunctata TaxID=420089 RepID=A0AAW1U7I9_9CUCU
MINPKYAAVSAAIYTLNISIFVVLLYSWRISLNIKKYSTLEDVYYGVQFAYFAIIGTQLFMICLSVLLLIGIYKVNHQQWSVPMRFLEDHHPFLSLPGLIVLLSLHYLLSFPRISYRIHSLQKKPMSLFLFSL